MQVPHHDRSVPHLCSLHTWYACPLHVLIATPADDRVPHHDRSIPYLCSLHTWYACPLHVLIATPLTGSHTISVVSLEPEGGVGWGGRMIGGEGFT